MTIVQNLIETSAGVADAYAQLDGVDMPVAGANDLTAELSVPGRYDDPPVRDAVERRARPIGRALVTTRPDRLLMASRT
jgi:2-keto-3-deoxy-L-rhamnonate aldolase RhmA